MLTSNMANNNKQQKLISVFGGRDASPELYDKAELLGRAIAENNWILLCGGRSGIMEATSKGCNEAGGMVIGILPGIDDSDANPYITIPIATGIGLARNEILACACDAAVAIGGKYGTLSEIAHALQYDKPLISLGSWEIDGSFVVKTVEEAVQTLKRLLK
ncbi:MAG: TIGR00725 family protein [Candidatus Marinimicrobia bacterium]|nr:TIGR00725 family protein [Candidatus Neomarinimicrobiota bacterium]